MKQEQTTAQQVEELLNTAKTELSNEATDKMVKRIKSKYQERINAAKILSNIDREIAEMKLELEQELNSIGS